ncbi:aldo/keto reductase [Pelagicoccus sp. SDUM812002]|uniref:aldo/keto reductase n=1 Tax=Pelagicoccus sp. SDUM812002 TaxID=3041266 RepID=UPI00280DE0C5|nr:aldo/keto reductase [Pelagicoccus sp. SDUM812002]MDQ8185740.1 aldo/keto reductase [Pelagicoccus sp. SDUM812002]
MKYSPSENRYSKADLYRRCGRSGLKLSRLSLGLWQNFGYDRDFELQRTLVLGSFDRGITHFDLANNYGPPPGSAESGFGRMLASDLASHRDELVISTKAGYHMWEGPYGDWGSRKYLVSSLDQSLKRMGLEYVDVFYHHRPDPDTPIKETMGALDHIVRSGKALYVGISNYNAEQASEAFEVLESLGTPCLIHQPRYNMFDRWVEDGLLDVLEKSGVGCIPFCPLAQGLLTDRYLKEIPSDSRIAKGSAFLKSDAVTEERVAVLKQLNDVAAARGQSLAQLALIWILRNPVVTSALIGASKLSQIEDNLNALENADLSSEELGKIESILGSV